MKKILVRLVALIFCVLVIFVAGRNFIVKAAVTKGVQALAGVKVEIKKVDIKLLKPVVEIKSLKVYNPPGFADTLMADIPQVYVEYDLAGFIKNKVHLKLVKIEVSELSVVLNDRGKLNFNSLAMLMPKSGAGKPPEVKVDELSLKIGKVGYKGYLPVLGTKSMSFDPQIDETFKDVTNPSLVASDVLKKILSRIGISNYASFDTGAAGNAVKEIKSTAKETLNKAKSDLKSILGGE